MQDTRDDMDGPQCVVTREEVHVLSQGGPRVFTTFRQ